MDKNNHYKDKQESLENLEKNKKNLEQKGLFDFLKNKQKIREKIKVMQELDKLKDLIKSGKLNNTNYQDILKNNEISKEILEIFKKIDQLNDENQNILPKDFSISKSEYLESFEDDLKKQKLLQKIDMSLNYLYNNIGGGGVIFSIFTLFSFNMSFFKKVKQTQENLIDIKNNIL